MKVSRIEKGWVFHWIPFCVAQTNGGGVIKGKNFMWLKWLFCFQPISKRRRRAGGEGRNDRQIEEIATLKVEVEALKNKIWHMEAELNSARLLEGGPD